MGHQRQTRIAERYSSFEVVQPAATDRPIVAAMSTPARCRTKLEVIVLSIRPRSFMKTPLLKWSRRRTVALALSIALPVNAYALSPLGGELQHVDKSAFSLLADTALTPPGLLAGPASWPDFMLDMSAVLATPVVDASATGLAAQAANELDAMVETVSVADAGFEVESDTVSHLRWGDDADYQGLLDALATLSTHGLLPEHYNLDGLIALHDDPMAREAPATQAWLLAAEHMLNGRVDPLTVEPNWTAPRRAAQDLRQHLARSLQRGTVATSLAELAPTTPEYQRMVLAMHELSAGMEAEPTEPAEQERASKIAQLRVNMERLRWLGEDLGERYLRVNIPAYELQAVAHGKVERTHRVIVGKRYRKTPVFSDTIKYVVLNPWWELPTRIARVDKLRTFKKDRDKFKRLRFQARNRDGDVVNPDDINWNELSRSNFPYRLRQAPGPNNALGQVKIIFPNRHNVYVHDTPTKHLFDAEARAFSSGCIRTEDPVALTEWVLGSTDKWSRHTLDAVLDRRRTKQVNLKKPVQVHILYLSVVSDRDGGVRYLKDLYDRDPGLLSALDEPTDLMAAYASQAGGKPDPMSDQ